MRWPTRFLLVTTIAAAAIVAASFGAGAPAAASERIETGAEAGQVADMSARKRHAKTHRTHRMKTHGKKMHRATGLRVHRLSRRAAEPPNADRPYYRPVPSFYPFAQDRGYF
ncbi:MAG: hypothetical protein R3D69_01160 [Xanthobacteraceae bacterium]